MTTIRTARLNDIPALRIVLTETWHKTYEQIYGADLVTRIVDTVYSADALAERCGRPHSQFLVCECEAKIVACAYMSAVSKTAVKLEMIYILPAMQGRGLGHRMLTMLLEAFPDWSNVRLEVDPQNTAAIGFYNALGFEAVDTISDCAQAGFFIPATVMEKTRSIGN